ncbi:hypothetical protein BAE44_0023064, partial [Dichanthelium oligosanthes]
LLSQETRPNNQPSADPEVCLFENYRDEQPRETASVPKNPVIPFKPKPDFSRVNTAQQQMVNGFGVLAAKGARGAGPKAMTEKPF